MAIGELEKNGSGAAGAKFSDVMSHLASNGRWDKGTAPAERFAQLRTASGYLIDDVFEKMGKEGCDPGAIDGVRREFDAMSGALSESAASYPDPQQLLHELKDSVKPGWAITSYTIAYHPGARENPPLRVLKNVLPYLALPHDFWSYGVESDRPNADMKSLLDGFKKMERHVVKSLGRARVDGLFGRRRLIDKVKAESSALTEKLDELANDAQAVNRAGYQTEIESRQEPRLLFSHDKSFQG